MGLLSRLSALFARNSQPYPQKGEDSSCAGIRLSQAVDGFFSSFLPEFMGQALVPGLAGVNAHIRFTIGLPECSVSWDVILESGCISSIQPMGKEMPDIEYQVSEETFLLVTGGKLLAERAFLSGKVKIRGSLLKGLKMASLLQSFFDRFPYQYETGLISDADGGPPDNSVHVLSENPHHRGSVAEVEDELCEEQFDLSEGEAALDLRLTYPMQGTCPWQVILVPPHPLLGATPDNEVLRFLARYLALRQCFVVRFGYSFGANPGSAPLTAIQTFWDTSDTENDLGLRDLMRVWDWLKRQPMHPDTGVALIGYSYGAQLVLKSLASIHPEGRVIISPVVSQLGEEVRQVTSTLLLVTADEDFASTPEESLRLSESFPVKPVWVPLPEADHFYRGKMELLARAIGEFLGIATKGSHEC